MKSFNEIFQNLISEIKRNYLIANHKVKHEGIDLDKEVIVDKEHNTMKLKDFLKHYNESISELFAIEEVTQKMMDATVSRLGEEAALKLLDEYAELKTKDGRKKIMATFIEVIEQMENETAEKINEAFLALQKMAGEDKDGWKMTEQQKLHMTISKQVIIPITNAEAAYENMWAIIDTLR